MPKQERWWEKDFEENYSPVGSGGHNSQWKYGAPSPESVRRFISMVESETRSRTLQEAEEVVGRYALEHKEGCSHLWWRCDCGTDHANYQNRLVFDISSALKSLENK